MQRYFFLVVCLLLGNLLIAQSTEDDIRTTLLNYMDGTSYNQKEQIEKAFYPEANLYLDGKDNKLNVIPIKKYASFFDNSYKGQFNGRIGKIISIDYFGNIAQAKVEILMPKRNLRYIDLFILKKIEGGWKIMSKTANSETSNKKGERILIVTSNAHFHGNSDLRTGNSFAEIVFSYDVFNDAGYTVDFVSPKGGAIPIGYINTSDTLQKAYLYNSDFMYALEHTQTPEETDAKNYKAIYFAGGGSAMYGVPENKGIQQIAMHIYEENNGIVSSVCHGSAGIINLKTKNGKYLVDGKNVNGYPDGYEKQEAAYYKQFPFKIQETLEKRGGTFIYGERNTPHVEIDGNLITGQNFLSSKQVAVEIVKKLKAEK